MSFSRLEKLVLFFFLLSFLLLGRLFYWQVVSGYDLAAEALDMRTQGIPINIARGDIMDRNGQLFTNTAVQYSVFVFPSQVKDIKTALSELQEVTFLSGRAVEEVLRKNRKSPPFRLLSALDATAAQKINALQLQGVMAVAENRRYDHNFLAAHVIGYINTADNKGVSGIEGLLDTELRGSGECVAAVVDASETLIPGLGYKKIKTANRDSEAQNVVLTLDKPTQKAVEKIMDAKILKGAVIVQKCATGEILAMASRPNFDAGNLGEYLSRDSSPLLNRAIAAYHPGSVFKLVVAAAALENKIVKPGNVFYDNGFIDVNKNRFWAWDYENGIRGEISFIDALAYSSNPVFIQTALDTGAPEIIEMASKMGFGSLSFIGLAGEMPGRLPKAQNLCAGDLANLAIGQGLCEATPLQVAQCASIIANGGIKAEPYLVRALKTADGSFAGNYQNLAQRSSQRVLSEQTALALQKMMSAVTHYGTGQQACLETFGSAGKTGSAETGRTDRTGRGISHAWFVGYVPIKTPQYVIVVFIEEGMSGGDVAAPIFRQIAAEVMRFEP